VEWASVDDEPAVREYSQPLGPNLTIDAVGYIYDLDERDLPDNSLPDDNVPEAGEEPVRIDPVDAGLERFTLGNGTIGGLSIPLDEEDLRAAFPEHEGWQIVPGTPTGHIQPDQPPETGIGLFRDDVLQLVATDSTVTVLSSDFVTTGGDRVGDTVDELQARHGTVLVQWIEFSGEYARYLGIDPSIGLALKADIAGPEAGLDYSEILHTDQWAHGSYVSSITVSANHAVGYRPPHFEFPEPCPLDEEPDFAEYALDDVDLDGRTERVAIRTCIDSVGQQQHAVLNLSHNPAPFQIPEPFVDISTENGVLTIEFQEFADSDAECCPTLDITEQYEFGPTGLVLTSRVVDG
jgi:hypothetical protein